MTPLDPNTIVLALIGGAVSIFIAWINRGKVPKDAAQAMADSIPPHAGVLLANGGPQSPPAVDEVKP